jgi:lariat debranching enzyme
MRILVAGCLHGAWETLVETATDFISQGESIDLIVLCGDGQTMRNEDDLNSFHCPPRYRKLGTFSKLYTGFIAGNHEACDFLPFGGWLAPNVFYVGRACSLSFGTLQITGLSGIFHSSDFLRPINEKWPLMIESDILSAVHYRIFCPAIRRRFSQGEKAVVGGVRRERKIWNPKRIKSEEFSGPETLVCGPPSHQIHC